MKAVLLAVGEAAVYSDFFQASMTYLRQALERLKIQADQAAACSADEEELFELVREYSRQSQLVVLLTAPQPEAAAETPPHPAALQPMKPLRRNPRWHFT